MFCLHYFVGKLKSTDGLNADGTKSIGKEFCNMMSNLGKKSPRGLAVTLTKDILPELVTKANSSILGKFERKISGQGAVITVKGFTLSISKNVWVISLKS